MEDKYFNDSIYNEEARSYAEKYHTDHMRYWPDMEVIDSDLLEQVQQYRLQYDWEKFTANDVLKALGSSKKKYY